jgi:tRNA-splicing ligase RtcB
MRAWLAEPMEEAAAKLIERVRRTEDVQRVAVMPDVHVAADVCVGTVVATSRLLFPSAVGGDIGCGMLALAFDAGADALADPARAAAVLKGLYASVPASRRHRSRVVPYPAGLRGVELSHGALEGVKRDDGALQLGTLGGGNHFIELQADEDERLWLMIHTGSRAIGQAVRGLHVSRASRVGGGMLALDADTPGGQAYVHDLDWARRYADANRRALAGAVVEVLGRIAGVRPIESSLITCDHNHVARETHGEQLLWLHRKGAMPAAAGAAGVLPGSMGTQSFHVEGRGCAEAMCSSAHGAGRALSREAARRRFSGREVCRQMEGEWFDYRLAESLRDESPRAYKDVRAVLRAQRDLVRVVRTLRPVLVFKGG